jgi:SOS response regulatory protein OraA/RecX
MPGLFGDDTPTPTPTIARITPDRSAPIWAHVIVGRRRVAKVPAARVEGLGIRVGAVWTPALKESAVLATETLRAKLRAIALLKVRDRASAELASRLARAGFSKPAAAAAIAELKSEGLLNDQKLAAHAAEVAASKGLSSAAVKQRLAKLGLAAATLPGDDLARATQEARNRAATLPESLSVPASYRRVLAALARLGYDEDVAREAAERVLGPLDREEG